MNVVKLAQEMIAINSVSSRSNVEIAALMRGWLESLGFEIEQLQTTDPDGEVKVSIVGKRGKGQGGIAYFCHNDVVPVDDWNATAGGPFSAIVSDGRLWGRGACDMKGSAAAALAAIARIRPQDQSAPVYFVATSDEEHGMHGARLVSTQSRLFSEMAAHQTVGIIGEPTELKVVNAHKGGCHLLVTSRGRAAHSSTADGLNANWQLIDFLQYVKQISMQCDSDPALQNSAFSPPTMSLNLVITNRPAATNITVGQASCHLFARPMPNVPWVELMQSISHQAQKMGLEVSQAYNLPPVFTHADSPFVRAALKLTGDLSPGAVSYATDGCWFTKMRDLIVLGPGSIEQAHRPDEWIALDQLERGVDVFQKFFEHFAANLLQAQPQRSGNQLSGTPNETAAIQIQYRRATDQDVELVNELLRPFVNQRKLLRRTRTEMETLVPSGFLAFVDDVPVGFSAVEIYSRKLAEIQCLAVRPEFQGHGIGSELVRRCVELARDRGVMEVLAISSSDSFLQKLGFNYSLPDQKRALFCQLRSRDEMFGGEE